MALSEAMRQKINQTVEKKTGVSTSPSSGSSADTSSSTKKTSNLSSALLDSIYKNVAMKRLGREDTEVDEDYIKKFQNDYRLFLYNAQYDYDRMTWQSSRDGEKAGRRSNMEQDLAARETAIRTWLDINRDYLDEETYKNISDYLDEFDVNRAGVMHNFDVKKSYFSQWETEEDYNTYVAEVEAYEAMANFDLDSGENEIKHLKSILETYQNLSRGVQDDRTLTSMEYIRSKYGEESEIKALISEKQQYLNQARRLQKGITFSGVADPNSEYYDPSFESKSAYATTIDPDPEWWQSGVGDNQYEWINNQNGFRSEYESSMADLNAKAGASSQSDFYMGPRESEFYQKHYDRLTSTEVAIYNYYYATEGKDKAQEYLDSIQESLNVREATAMFADMDDKTFQELVFGVEAGLDQFKSGVANLFNTEDDYIPQSAVQIASGMVREDLGESGKKLPEWLGGASLGQVGYDIITTSANMAPSIMTSAVVGMLNPVAGEITGSVLMGASSAGNAYQEMLNLGYDKKQARMYSTLVGSAEAGLQYLLGGVGKLGGKLSGEVLTKMMNGVDNAFLRTALKLAGSMASEGIEEGLTEILTPWMQNLTLYTDEKVNWSEVAYSTLLGALTAGVMEGLSTISGEVGTYNTGAQLKDAGITPKQLAEVGNTFAADTVAAQLAGRVNENTGAYTMGRLFNEIGATMTEQNVNDIANALIKDGMPKDMARKNAKAMAAIVEGGDLSELQISILEANESLAKAVRTTIIDPNATWFQRTKGYNEALMALAQEKTSTAKQPTAGQDNAPAVDNVDAKNNSGAEGTAAAPAENETFQKSTGKAVTVKEVAAIKDGKVTLRLEDGQTVAADDVSFGNEGEALFYDVVAKMGTTPNAANILASGFNSLRGDPVAVNAYAHGIEEAFRYGKLGIPARELSNTDFASKLTAAQQDYVYRQGKKAAGRQVAVAQATVKKTLAAAKNVEKAINSGKNNSGSYHATLEEGITPLSLNESQKASYELADQIAQAAKVNVVVYVGNTGEQGYYAPETDKIYLNLNATNKSRKSMMAFTLGHELVHRAKKGSPAKYQAFAEFLMKEYSKNSASVETMIAQQMEAAKEHGIEMSEEKAFEEVVADACLRMLLDTDAGQKLAEFGRKNEQNKSFLEDLKRWITEFMDRLRKIFKDVDPGSLAAQEFDKFDKNVKQILADMYVDMTIDAGENLSVIQNAFGKGTKVEVNEHGEFTMASSPDGSEKVFNLVTWKNGGRETLEATLLREGYTEEEVTAALTIMDGKQELVEKIANELDENGATAFPEQGRINEATLTTDLKDGHSVLSALVSNGDYPVNIDLLMVCKKRQAYQRVINRLCETGLIQQATVDALAIAEINKILGKYGFETACLGCFVESRRLRIQEWAQTIVKEWNSEVKKRSPNAQPFGFGKGEATLSPDEVMQLIGELESSGEKNDKGNLNLGQGSAVKRMGVLLDKVPSLRKTLAVEDLITPDGLTALRQFDSNLFSMVKSRYGSNSPKFVQEFNPYNHELAMYGKVPQQYKNLREYLYAIGGARMQSFSDFIVENWFDYCQIVADLAARKLPMHTYTKEIALAKLFGMTGIKINMSLIPDVDRSLDKEYAGLTRNAKGELELIWADKDRFKATGGKSYMQSINFADAIALQNDPRYSANVGTIAVGISDKHIRMMLNDSRIRMVIPYHSSGMNPIFADLMGTSYYKDYTNVQNTTVKQMYNSKGKPVTLKLTKPQVSQLTGGFQFNEVLQNLGDARAAAEAYKDWCADASKHTITIKGETYTAELTPKFNDFTDETNYYKLLEDFNPYDCITEEAAPQGDVQQIYPEGFEEILRGELSSREGHRRKQEKNQSFDKAMVEIESFLKTHTKADTVHYANQHGIKLGAKDKKLDAAGKERLKQLQDEGASFSLPKVEKIMQSDKQIAENIREVANMNPVHHVDSSKLDFSGRLVQDIYKEFFDSWGNNIHSDVFGDIAAVNSSVRSEKRHGTTPPKIASIEAIPEVINRGKIIGYIEKHQGKLLRIVVAAPITIGKESYYMGVMLQRDNQNQRLYIHDVITEKEASNPSQEHLDSTGPYEENEHLYLSNILEKIRDVKREAVSNKLSVGEDTSPRALLANALESAAQNDIERNRLKEYRGKIDLINAEEKKLQELNQQIKDLSFAKGPKDTKAIRDLQFEAMQTANRISVYDKQLLRLEASKPLQNVLEREKKMAYQRAEKKGKEALAAYRERATKAQRQMMDRYKESRERAKESREKTAMRHKIQNIVGELNNLLLNGDKKRHVPENLKRAVADALALVNMDTVGADERIAKYEALIARETDPDKIDAYTITLENIRRKGEQMGQRLKELRDAYEEFQKSDDPDIANAYDPVIAGCLNELSQSIGNTSLRDMSIEQLSDVYDMYRMVLTRVRDANKTFLNDKKEAISNLASRVVGEVRIAGGDHKYRAAILDPLKKFGWNNLKPVYAFEHIGSSTLMDAFDKVRSGEDVWAKDVTEAREFYLDKSKKYGYDSWDFKKKYQFESDSGTKFELTLEQILSLYAYSKREQAHDHLKLGGFVFDSNIETYKEGGKKLIKYKVNTADAHQITPEILAGIVGTLTTEQMGFVDEMQDYLSTVMGAKGNEITMQMYGVKLFKEKFYFPLKSAKQFMFEQNEVSGEVRIKNSGFTNKVVANANNPVILSNFMDVWANHVNDMSMYHAFVLPLEDFNRIFNYNSPKKEGQPPVSVKGTIQSAYTPAAVSYVKQLITDLNGGARTDPTTGFINFMMGLYKRGAVFASASVVIQQPSAIARAAALVDLKYFIGPKADHKRHKLLWDEVKKYAPVAIIKEMGYFDTNMGKSTQDFITGREYSGIKEKATALVKDSNYRDEVLSKAPALADEIAWCSIWEAVKRETQAKNPGMDTKSEAFLQKAGKRFTEVITKTQVYDSVLARSANMRAKDTGMKMATAFMAEPTTAINMVLDALRKGKRGGVEGRRFCRKTIGAVVAAQILNAFLVSWVYAARDDDEEKSFTEKYLSSLASSIIDGVNPATYFPFIKDVASIVMGYDVERSDMAVVSDLLNAWEQLKKDDVTAWRKVEGFVGGICQIFGLPVKNIMRDVRALYQAYDTIVNGEDTTSAGIKYAITEAITGKSVPNTEQLYRARLEGDAEHEARVEARYDDEDSADAAVRAAIKDSYMEGEIDLLTARNHLITYAGMDVQDAHWLMDAWEYRKEHGSDEDYNKYNDFYEAVRTGNDLRAVIQEYTDNGVKKSTLTGQITEHFKPEYVKMSVAERANIKGYILNGFELCGMDREDAEKKLQDWDFEAKHGFSYSDRKQAYMDGEISASQLQKILINEKGYEPEDAAAQIEVYEWEKDGIEGATIASVQAYNEWCKSAGVSREDYLHIRQFSNNTENDVDDSGKPIYYSAVQKVMAEIDSLKISSSQKTAIAMSLWKDTTVQKYKLW